MILPEIIFNSLQQHRICIFSEVPDFLGGLRAYVDDCGQCGKLIINTSKCSLTELRIDSHISTVAGGMSFAAIYKAIGYTHYQIANEAEFLKSRWGKICNRSGSLMLEVKMKSVALKDLGRPARALEKYKCVFLGFLYE